MRNIRCLVRLSASLSNLTDNAQRLRPTPTRQQPPRSPMTSVHSLRYRCGVSCGHARLRRASPLRGSVQREELRESPTTPRCALRAPRDADESQVKERMIPMANIYFYPDELEPLIEDIINDGRDALFAALAKMTDIERKKILSQTESTFIAAKNYMERSGNNDYVQKLNAYFGGNKYYKLCLAIGHFALHKRLSGAETALAIEQRQQLRNVRRRRKTQKEKILSVCMEIHQLKRQGRTWRDICYYLRTAHRKLFQDASLNLRYLKRVYALWKSSLQGNVPNDP
jgi:hypothetical protein